MTIQHASRTAPLDGPSDAMAAIIYSNMEELVYHLAVEGVGRYRFKFVNPAFHRASGLAPEQVLQQLLDQVVPAGAFDRIRRHYEQAIHSRATVRWEEPTPYFSGLKIGAVSVTPIFDAQGRCTDLVGTMHDISELRRKQDEVQANNLALRKLSEQLERRAYYDMLTGLPNRALFRERLDAALARYRPASSGIALMFVNICRFKEINDLLGHRTGDQVLTQVAQRLQHALQAGDTLARLGGDEFAIIVGADADLLALERLARKLQRALSAPYRVGADRVVLSTNAGVAIYPQQARGSEELMRHADQALRNAKRAGLNQVRFYEQAMQAAALARLALIADLQRAVTDNKLELYFQPIVDMPSGRIVKAEALVRWHRDQVGLIMPLEFISIAEETGIIHELGNWVFGNAADWCRRWTGMLGTAFPICINKSPVQFRQQLQSMDWIGYLDQIGLPHDAITVEITEGVLLDLSQAVLDKLHRLHAGGIKMSIDDFGTGYSSMSYLKQLDIDFLKIDRSFVAEVLQDRTTRIIAETIVYMAHKLDMQVVAEGVETQAQHDWLLAQGCDFGQGYHYSAPVPAGEFEAMLMAQAEGNPALNAMQPVTHQ
ncbi:putative bifunctional diguanylate cyclase/phosphodiesterase [Massilia sp. S19_KUP03_FR1]|uniref:putative bifunctional diguanylate cyclase/phosphodiesterase n=1 Tax=Massilia sp. S19_KUP03_FR1 TaxID=3025503 RepID=UPI002FCD8E7D